MSSEPRRLDTLIELLETRQLLSEAETARLTASPPGIQVAYVIRLSTFTVSVVSGEPIGQLYSFTRTAAMPEVRMKIAVPDSIVHWRGVLLGRVYQANRTISFQAASVQATGPATTKQSGVGHPEARSQPIHTAPAEPREETNKPMDRALPVEVVVRAPETGIERPLVQADVMSARQIVVGQTKPISGSASHAETSTLRDRVLDVWSDDTSSSHAGPAAAAAMMAVPLSFRQKASEKLTEALRISREGVQAIDRAIFKPVAPAAQSGSPVLNPSLDDSVSFGRHIPREASSAGAGFLAAIKSSRKYVIWMLAMLIGMGLIVTGTKQGIGTFGDSVTYFTAARSLVEGTGLAQQTADGGLMPLSQFPPGYPTTLAIGSWLTGDILIAARWLNVIASGVTILLAGMITYRFTRSVFVSGTVGILLACHGQMIGVHVRMYSEAMYIALTLAVMAALLQHGGRGWWLVLAGVLAGVAALTRFAGIHLIACCAIWIVAMNWHRGWRATAGRGALFVLPAMGAMLAWSVRNLLLSGQASSRSFAFHPPRWNEVLQIFQVMKHWVIPIDGIWQTPAMYLAFALWGIVPLIVLWRFGIPRTGARGRLMLPVLFVLTYLPFILVARTFFDAAIPFNYRLMMPMFPLSLVVGVIWLTHGWMRLRRQTAVLPARGVAGVVSVLVSLLLTRQVWGGYTIVERNSHQGLGYTSRDWTDSPTIAAIRALPPDQIVYTNAADAVYLLTGRTVRILPRSAARRLDGRTSRMHRDLATLHKTMSREQAVVVYFNSIKRDGLLVSEEQFKARVTDTHCERMPDARIYSIRHPKVPVR